MKTFDDLFTELSAKAAQRPEGSKTVAELDSGVHGIGKKVVEEAAEAGHKVRPFLVGPVTLIALSKPAEWSLLPSLVEAYAEVFAALKEAGVEWVQIAEPAVVADLSTPDAEITSYLREAWTALLGRETRPNVYLTTPYGSAREALPVLGELGVEALHVDLSPWTLEADAGYPERVRATVEFATGLPVSAVLVIPEHPTDIRHNSKIDRAELSDWAERALATGKLSSL